jgi:hypothetical protein
VRPTVLLTPASHPASPPSLLRRRRPSSRLAPATVAALRDLLAPPAESEAEAEQAVADIMARVYAECGVAAAAR